MKIDVGTFCIVIYMFNNKDSIHSFDKCFRFRNKFKKINFPTLL